MKRMIKRLSLSCVLLGPLLVLLAGCAVMRVDVDVYKGPLADEEHVQIQRLAVLAVGAKPLLLQARNELMHDDQFACFLDKGYGRNDVIRYERKCASSESYAPSGKCKSPVNYSPDAEKCPNGSFREAPTQDDWGDRDRARIINDILLLYDNMENYSGYESYVVAALGALDELRKATADLSGALTNEYVRKVRGENPRLYREFVEPFTDGPGADSDAIQKAIEAAYRHLSALKSSDAKNRRTPSASQVELEYVVQRIPLVVVQARSIVRTFLSALVDNENRADANTRIAHEQRKTIVSMLLVFLNINLAQEKLQLGAGRYRDCSGIKEEFSPLFKRYSAYFGDKADDVGRQLFCAPGQFGRDLLDMDKAFGDGDATLGIAWLPRPGTGSSSWLERIDTTAQAVSNSLYRTIDAGSLSAGRVGPGLEKLMQDYLEAQHEEAPGADKKKRQLADALIQFAQKMLFVSNNSIFLDQNAEKKATTTLRDCGAKSVSDKDKERCANLLSVIEVVGNSILVQANELHARNEHTKDMLERGAARRKSIATAFSGSSTTVVDSILGRISARKAEIDTALAPESKLVAALGKATDEAAAASKERQAADRKLAENKDSVAAQEKLLSERTAALEGSNDPRFLECLPAEAVPVTPASELARFSKAEPCAKALLAATPASETARKKRLTELARELQVRAVSSSLADFRTALATDNKATEGLLKKHREVADASENEASRAKSKEDDKKKLVAEATSAQEKFRKDNAEWMRTAERHTPAVMKLLNDTAKQALTDPRANAASIHLEWLNIIESSGADETVRSHAAALVSSTPSPIAAPPDLLEPDPKRCDSAGACPPDAMKSMDALIAWLQSNRTRILADYGEKSDVYLSAEAAIKQAQLDRAGLTYIRPASSYLRSSYPASALQQNQRLGWQNMLGVSYKRSVPLLGGLLRDDSYYDVLSAIDKQFWQNINTVRVSGGGNSNYVLVKDDTGNIVVRSFSTNYKGLLNSLKGMALFNYGEKLDASLALNDGAPRATGEARLTAKSSGLGGLFASYRDAFADERLKAYGKLVAALKSPGIASAIKAEWDADAAVKDAVKLGDVKRQLDGFYDRDLKASAEKVAETAKPDGFELTYEALGALRSFKKDLLTLSATFTAAAQAEFTAATADVAAANARPDSDPDKPTVLAAANLRLTNADTAKKHAEAAASKAQSIAIGKVGPLMAAVTASREASIHEYERALAFIGEAANRDAAPDPVPAKDVTR